MNARAEGVSRPPACIVPGSTGEDIQRAVDSLPRGGFVVLEPNRYTVSRPILLHDGISILGSGAHRTIIELSPGSSCHVFTNVDHQGGNRDIEIEGLSIEGNGDKQPKPNDEKALVFCNAIYLRRVTSARVRDLTARDIRQTAVHFSGCENVRIDELFAERLGWSGLSTSGTSKLLVSRSYIRDSGRDIMHSGIHLDGGVGARLVDVHSSSSTGNAIMLDSTFAPLSQCDLVRVHGATSKRGVSISGSGKHPLEGVVIRNSFCRNNREVGVLVSNASEVFVCDTDLEANLEEGILLQGRQGAQRCLITGCTFISNGTAIREAHASANNSFLDNRYVSNAAGIARRDGSQTLKPVSDFIGAADPSASSTGSTRADAATTTGGSGESTEAPHRAEGRCWVCGVRGTFVDIDKSIRESYRCESCRASVRYQAKAEVLVQLWSREGATCLSELAQESAFQRMRIYEPGVLGPFRKILRQLPQYVVSDYWPDVPPGDMRNGVRCEDLMNLTHRADSFDLVITSDIFEHVRRPLDGFREIRRVLRPGGSHVFSIPVMFPLPRRTVKRVDTTGAEDVLLLEPRYHKGPGESRHIVYNDFGEDLLGELDTIGLRTEVVRFEGMFPGSDRVVTFHSVREI